MSVGATASSRTSNPPTSSSATRPNSREGTNTGTSTGASSSSNDSGSADSTSRTGRSTSTTTDGSDRSSQTSSGSEDRSEISSEASRTDQSPKSEKETRNDHLRALEDNFSIFDNPEGGDNDGISGLGDFEKVAGGEYDREGRGKFALPRPQRSADQRATRLGGGHGSILSRRHGLTRVRGFSQ